MEIEVKANKSKTIKLVNVKGEIEVYNSVQLKKKVFGIIEEGNRKMVINLADVPYMDSSGIGVLVNIVKKIRSAGGNMKIANINTNVHKVLKMTRLDKFFEIYDDEKTALKSFM